MYAFEMNSKENNRFFPCSSEKSVRIIRFFLKSSMGVLHKIAPSCFCHIAFSAVVIGFCLKKTIKSCIIQYRQAKMRLFDLKERIRE